MTSKTDPPPDTGEKSAAPKNVLPDLIIPVMALAFAIYYLTTITEVPWIAQASAVLVSGLLMLSITAFAIRTAFRLRAGTEVLRISGLTPDRALLAKRLILLALTIGYVWFLEILGFTLSTLFFLFLSIMLLSSVANWRRALLIAVGCSLIGYVVFIFIFETRFPRGPVENYLKETFDAG